MQVYLDLLRRILDEGAFWDLQYEHCSYFTPATLRTFDTGSWVGRRFQGRGTGTEMRAAALHLMFAGLGAREATTSAI